MVAAAGCDALDFWGGFSASALIYDPRLDAVVTTRGGERIDVVCRFGYPAWLAGIRDQRWGPTLDNRGAAGGAAAETRDPAAGRGTGRPPVPWCHTYGLVDDKRISTSANGVMTHTAAPATSKANWVSSITIAVRCLTIFLFSLLKLTRGNERPKSLQSHSLSDRCG